MIVAATVVWCCVFAAVHAFWALGGGVGLASSAGAQLATRRPLWFVLLGLWGTAVLLLAGAGLAGWSAVVASSPRWRRAGTGTIALVGVVLLVRAVAVESALLANVGGVRTAAGPVETRWSLALWNPWFALGAALFLALAVQLSRRYRGEPRTES
ncbi:hypothetical protein Athai_31480 [Actinocatenispora thailandica]|uniref:DUF3995 domain-containing protein n=1 Tax=Actinocatenispora thailandica TaxID=227318 RepID=A0A7R7DQ86_9ACTN|nr:hypothetical protein Athai_31480 [Actinocatenispora thailandica]